MRYLETSLKSPAPPTSVKPAALKPAGKFVAPSCHGLCSLAHHYVTGRKFQALSFFQGRERQEWTACPMFWSFRRAAKWTGFCLTSIRVLMGPGISQTPESHGEQSIWVMCHCSRGSTVPEPKANIVQQPLPLPQEGREEWEHGICIQYSNFGGVTQWTGLCLSQLTYWWDSKYSRCLRLLRTTEELGITVLQRTCDTTDGHQREQKTILEKKNPANSSN